MMVERLIATAPTLMGRSSPHRTRRPPATGMAKVSPQGVQNSETLSPGCSRRVLAKHSKSFSLIDCISVGVDRMQRNFEPMQKQVEAGQRTELTDVTTKVVRCAWNTA